MLSSLSLDVQPLITSTRTLLLIDDAVEVSTPEDPAHPRPAVVALCSDVIVIGFKMIPKDEKLYFDWRLEGQRIIKLTRCEVVQGEFSRPGTGVRRS